MTINPCMESGCESAGVFPGVVEHPDGPVTGFWCFGHDPGGILPTVPTDLGIAGRDDVELFHLDVVAGFAAMVLEHAAMTATESGTASDDAMRSLAANSALALDLAAGIIVAITAVTAAGEVTPEQVTELAAIYEEIATREDEDEDQVPDEESQMSRLADDLGYVSGDDDAEVGPDDDRDAMANEEPCPACDGNGLSDYETGLGESIPCTVCEGRGVIDIAGPAETLVVADDETEISPAAVVEDEATKEPSNDER